MRKLPIPPSPTTAYTTKTSKQKTTNEEKQANKKESDSAGRGFGGELERSGERGGGTWKLHSFKSTLFSILPTSALSISISISVSWKTTDWPNSLSQNFLL